MTPVLSRNTSSCTRSISSCMKGFEEGPVRGASPAGGPFTSGGLLTNEAPLQGAVVR